MEPPEGSSSVLSARRTSRPGMTTFAPSWTVTWFEIADTSVLTCRLMRPSERTTGVNARATPNGLNWIETWPDESTPVGTGNSPPARNEAFSPEIAVSVGSARVLIMPVCSRARSVALTLLVPSS